MSLSIGARPPAGAGERWRGEWQAAFGFACHIDLHAPHAPQLRLVGSGGAVRTLFEIGGGACRLGRDADPQRDKVLVVAQLEGECHYREGDAATKLAPGSLCLCRARRAAEFAWSEDFRAGVLVIPESRLSAVRSDWARLAATAIASDDGPAAVFAAAFTSALTHHASISAGVRPVLDDALIALLGAVLQQSDDGKGDEVSRLEAYHKAKIHRFISAELRNPDLDIPLIAAAVGLSQRYVHRLFAGEPLRLMQLVWAQRLDNCYRELASGDGPQRHVSEIAFAWGFNDPAHFSRSFRKRFGTSPSKLRHSPRSAP